MDALKRKKPAAADSEEYEDHESEEYPEEESYPDTEDEDYDEDDYDEDEEDDGEDESFIDRLKEQLKDIGDKLKGGINNLKKKLKKDDEEEEEEEEEEEDEADDGLTTVDPHFQSAFEQMQKDEEEEARKAEEEAARKTAEQEAAAQSQGGADPALVEQLFMVLDKWEEIWVQQFQTTHARIQVLEEKIDSLAEKLEEGVQAFPTLPPLPTAPIPLEGQSNSDMPPFPTTTEPTQDPSTLLIPDSSKPVPTRPPASSRKSPTQSSAMALLEIEELVKHPLAGLLSISEIDNVVALVLEPTGIDIWKVQDVRQTKTPYREHHQSEEQVRNLLRNLDTRLKKVESFEEDKQRLGYIIEAFSDPVYRHLINQRAFLKGDGTMIPPTKDAYDRVASAVGLRQWIESLEKDKNVEVTSQLIPENSELFIQRYYLLPPEARQKLHSALIDEYVSLRREELKKDAGPGDEPESNELGEPLPEGVELIDESALEQAL